jgi:hypothetical protein
MTVKELIEALQNYPPDTRVIVMGYESGYDDITLVKQIAILPEEKPAWYIGRFDDAPQGNAGQAEQAVLVYGRNERE